MNEEWEFTQIISQVIQETQKWHFTSEITRYWPLVFTSFIFPIKLLTLLFWNPEISGMSKKQRSAVTPGKLCSMFNDNDRALENIANRLRWG